MYNDTFFNILVSYAWLGGSSDLTKNVFEASKRGDINLMIDSGAFTLFNAKNKQSYKHITLDGYSNFLDIYGPYCQKYVMLDKIADEKQSKENYEEMVRRGLNPMYVLTMFDNEWDYLNDAVSLNPHVCVAGGVTTKSDWITKRFQDVDMQTNQQALIHGLGYVTYPKMFQLPLKSVDSSSWAQSSMMYGVIPYFDNGLKSVGYKDVLTKKVKLPEQVKEMFEKYKISPKMFSNLDNHRGGRNIAVMMSIVSHFEYQKLAKRKGLDFFLSIGTDGQLQSMLHINDKLNEGTLTYEGFRNMR